MGLRSTFDTQVIYRSASKHVVSTKVLFHDIMPILEIDSLQQKNLTQCHPKGP